MKRIAILLMFALCIGLTGCSKDAEVQAFITEFDGATKDIVAKIDANPTAAGIDEAQHAFDARKPALKAKWDGIKNAAGFQVSKDTTQKLQDSVKGNLKSLMDVSARNAIKLSSDRTAPDKLKKLMEDYQGTFTMSGSN